MGINNFPKYTIIIRNYTFDEAHAIAKAIEGLEQNFAMEITMNTPSAPEYIKNLNKEFGQKILIGAGTVLNLKDEIAAVDANAKFLLSSCLFSKNMIDYAKQKNVITIPGAYTPTEVLQMLNYKADIIKIFPAITAGPEYFKNLQGPLGKIPLMAVGGISSENVGIFLKNGAQFIGIGSGAFLKEDIINKDVPKLRQSLIDIIEKS